MKKADYQDAFLTNKEAREFLKIGRTKLWHLTKNKEFPVYRIGPGKTSSLRYKKSDLVKWLEKSKEI